MSTVNKLSTDSYRGARDFFPEDMAIQNHIFDIWRRVCKRFGYEEYSFPIIEPWEIFAAKSGAEIVNEQLFAFEDRSGRKLAIRPELTPGTVRMIAQKATELPKPLRWFMIGNNWRYEKPQKGRTREFYQLEANIFGENNVFADLEIFQLIMAIMREFGATEEMFRVYFSDRRLINALLQDELHLAEQTQLNVRRLMDRRKKMEQTEFFKLLGAEGLSTDQSKKVEEFMHCKLDEIDKIIAPQILENNPGFQNIMQLNSLLEEQHLSQFCAFEPGIIRGFDYSDGLVYEVFDLNPENRRSMFGGERFDRLIHIFTDQELPATGFAMGDVTLREFLKGWNLLPPATAIAQAYITVFDDEAQRASIELAQNLRNEGIAVLCALKSGNIGKQLEFAAKKNIPFAIIIGETELAQNTFTLKNLKNSNQESLTYKELVARLQTASVV